MSKVGWEAQINLGFTRQRPPLRDDLMAGIEIESFWPVNVGVTKQGALPPTKKRRPRWVQGWDVDAHHTNLDVELKLSGGTAITSEDNSGVRCRIKISIRHNHHTAIEFLVATGPRGPINLSSTLHRMSALNDQIPETGVAFRRADRNQFDGLVNYLHQDVRVQEFGETTLQPVLLHDARNDSDLMLMLSTLLEHPTSRSAAAQELHLSRTALYSRIATIERLLGVDLNKGEDFFGLSLAVRSYYGA